jgi:hypothetical protein
MEALGFVQLQFHLYPADGLHSLVVHSQLVHLLKLGEVVDYLQMLSRRSVTGQC